MSKRDRHVTERYSLLRPLQKIDVDKSLFACTCHLACHNACHMQAPSDLVELTRDTIEELEFAGRNREVELLNDLIDGIVETDDCSVQEDRGLCGFLLSARMSLDLDVGSLLQVLGDSNPLECN